jgi:opacity protein-like surface antigen
MWLVEFGAFYQAGKWFLDGKKEGRTASVDVLAGGRYWYMHGDLDTSIPYSSSTTNQFLDPMIGARVTVDLTDTLSFRLKGDIGGFGVGSDFTWNALAGFGYQFTKGVTALLGYRYLYMDYKTGTSSARYHITMQGPIGGVMFIF